VLAEKGKTIQVPGDLHKPITQEMGVLTHSKNQPGARAFAAFLTKQKGREILAQHGYRN
jgi:ABC-type molybdate transport system substrate-binding protein